MDYRENEGRGPAARAPENLLSGVRRILGAVWSAVRPTPDRLVANQHVWRRVAPQAVLSLGAFLLLWRVDQLTEIYIVMADEPLSARWVLGLAGLAAACLALWRFARLSVEHGVGVSAREVSQSLLAQWVPRLVGVAPAIGLAIGAQTTILRTTADLLAYDLRPEDAHKEIAALVVLAAFANGVALATFAAQLERHVEGIWSASFARVVGFQLFVALMFGLLVLYGGSAVLVSGEEADAATLRIQGVAFVGALTILQGLALWLRARSLADLRAALSAPSALGRLSIWLILGGLALAFLMLMVPGLIADLLPWVATPATLVFAALAALATLLRLGARLAEDEEGCIAGRREGRLTAGAPADERSLNATFLRSALGLLVLLPALGLLSFWPSVMRSVGPLAILMTAVAVFGAVGAVALWGGRRTGWPITTLVLATAVVAGGLGLVQDNIAREVAPTEAAPVLRPPIPNPNDAGELVTAASAFDDWWSPEREGDCGTAIVVAAQGGGHYAAWHAASVLAGLEDAAREARPEGPGFVRCVFAISGVSGGAIGASVFAAAVDARARCLASGSEPCSAPLAGAVDAALRRDLLSPLGARFLFADMPWSLLPFSGSFADRSRALEEEVAAGLKDWESEVLCPTTGCGIVQPLIDTSILQSWTPEGDAPLLLLNTTDVATGQRLILTPLQTVGSGRSATWRSVRRAGAMPEPMAGTECTAGDGWSSVFAPPLKTAMVLSARFPLVTPPGRLRFGDANCAEADVMDGGFFENSGVETALDVVRAIRGRDARGATPRIGVLVIGFDFGPDTLSPTVQEEDLFVEDVAAPVLALLAARQARGDLTKDQLWDKDLENVVVETARLARDADREYALGWFLSERTFDRIRRDSQVCAAYGAAETDVCLAFNRGGQSRGEDEPPEDSAIQAANAEAMKRVVDWLDSSGS